jgi:hypothetical protein
VNFSFKTAFVLTLASTNLAACAIAQAVTGFPPWWPGFDPRSGHVGFVVDEVAGVLRVLRFLLPFLTLQTAPHSSPSGLVQ